MNITIEIKADDTPEVAEAFTVNLVNVTGMDKLQAGAVSITLRRWEVVVMSTYHASGNSASLRGVDWLCGNYVEIFAALDTSW